MKEYKNFPLQNGHAESNKYVTKLVSELPLTATVSKRGASYAVPISGESYVTKSGHNDGDVVKFTEELWQTKVAKTPNIFNGSQVTITQRLYKDGAKLKLSHNTFATVTASRSDNKPENLTLRDHFTAGVIIVCITKDNKIIIGTRGDANATTAQFPCGFIGGEKDLSTEGMIAEVAKNEGALLNIIQTTGIKEGKEEIFKSFKGSMQCIGSIGKVFTHPSQSSDDGTKKVFSVKSFVGVIRSEKTLEEIQQDRKNNPPKDRKEMEIMASFSLDEISGMNHDSKVRVGDRDLPFVAEHGHVIDLLNRHIAQEKSVGEKKSRS